MMLSRIAEHFYWFGRYLERAENTARLLLSYSDMVLDLPERSGVGWYQLVEITGSQNSFHKLGKNTGEAAVLRFMITDARNPGSIHSSVLGCRNNLRTIRDRVPSEMTESLNELRAYVEGNAANSIRRSAARTRFLRGLVDHCQTLRGHMRGSMLRSDAFYFIVIGRMLERADMTTRIMDVRVDDLLPDALENLPAFDGLQWMSVLRALSASQMYLRVMHGQVRAASVIEFLLLNEEFPRSVHYAVASAKSGAEVLPKNKAVLSAMDHLIALLQELKTKRLANEPSALRASIDAIQLEISEIDRLLNQAYFLHDAQLTQQQ